MIYVALFHSMRMVYSNSSGMISSTSTLATEPFSVAIRNRRASLFIRNYLCACIPEETGCPAYSKITWQRVSPGSNCRGWVPQNMAVNL
jgi:hypothetical protein